MCVLLLSVCLLMLPEHTSAFGQRDAGLLAMEAFMKTQKTITEDLERYISQELAWIKNIQKFLSMYKQQRKDIEGNAQYIQNPINAFTLIKRLTVDLNLMAIVLDVDRPKWKWRDYEEYPNTKDLEEAVYWILLLQTTYGLNVTQLANGTLVGNFTRGGQKYIEQTSKLTASDCYKLAHGSYQTDMYAIGALWMEEVYHKYKIGDNFGYPFTSDDILFDIIFACNEIGDDEKGLKWAQKLAQNDGKFDKPIARHMLKSSLQRQLDLYSNISGSTDLSFNHSSRKSFSRQIVEHFTKRLKFKESEQSKEVPTDNASFKSKHEDSKEILFGRLCRGEMELPGNLVKSLKCRYLTETHPFLKLAPLKLEQLYLDPDVALLYDAMTDDEIEVLKKCAKPNLRRAGVYNSKGQGDFDSLGRITHVAWTSSGDWDPVVLQRISRRVVQLTGLNEQSLESLQVANYGVGGWFSIHNDFSNRPECEHCNQAKNDRVATVMFYMSEVAQGGATVFDELGLTVFPVKNAALMWTNLFPSGEGNLATAHGACPVLRGTKWVANQWIRQIGLELIRPCNLEFQKRGIHRYYPPPVFKTQLSHK